MSTPRWDIPDHFPMPINITGGGPELDPEKVIRTICWSCIPYEDWPCAAARGTEQEPTPDINIRSINALHDETMGP